LKKLSSRLNLELAWKRVRSDQYNDIVPDILQLRDVDYDRANTLARVGKRLDKGYEPSELLTIDVPKRGYTLRLGSNMVPEDRIVYQAVVDFISGKIEEPPKECVFSYRLDKSSTSRSMFRFWRKSWLEWRKEMRRVYKLGYRCLLRTDIAAYFEHIDHRILRNEILNGQIGPRSREVLDLLGRLLQKWAPSSIKHIGIPQGCDASSFIGNIYLINLDKTMKRKGFKYFRYSDEIYVLTKGERQAREAIGQITRELRKLHLNLQEAKTDIITRREEVEKEIGTPEEDRRRDFDYEFQSLRGRKPSKELQRKIARAYSEVTKKGRVRAKELEVSKFRWCINRLIKIRSDKAVNFTLKRLRELPFLADLCFKYLRLFAHRKHVRNAIIDFLRSEDNIYAWQEMWLLLTLSHARKLDEGELQVVRDIISDPRKHWASRVAAILVLGKLGDDTDRRSLTNLYWEEDNTHVKRAIAVGVHRLPKATRDGFYSQIENDSDDMERLVKYLKQTNIETI